MEIYRFLEEHGVPYERHDHPAVFTVEESERLVPPLPGVKTKNLFLRDDRGRRHILVTVPAGKTADLKALGVLLGVKKLGFASPDRLRRILGLDPGAVTILGVVNDENREVEVVVDRAVWEADSVQCHPLVNTSTLVIPLEGIRKLMGATGHDPRVLDVPARAGT